MKNKKGKKLVVLGAMAALLTLIGVSGSQTYAKYVEKSTVDSQSATVAKWGLVVDANAEKLFSDAYVKDGLTENAIKTTWGTNPGIIIKGETEGRVILAPGATGSIKFGVHGKAEVSSRVTFSLNSTAEVHLDDYKPVKWTLKQASSSTALDTMSVVVDDNGDDNDTNNVPLQDVNIAEIATYLNRVKDFAPNTDVHEYYELSYSWVFDSGDDLNDEKDTDLGRLAAGKPLKGTYGSTSKDLAFTLGFTVEQTQGA